MVHLDWGNNDHGVDEATLLPLLLLGGSKRSFRAFRDCPFFCWLFMMRVYDCHEKRYTQQQDDEFRAGVYDVMYYELFGTSEGEPTGWEQEMEEISTWKVISDE